MADPIDHWRSAINNGDPPRPDSKPMPMIKRLRMLHPQRPVSIEEGISIAEQQASRLLTVIGADQAPIPEEAVTGLSRIAVRRDRNLPSKALVHWHNDTWLIHVNSTDHPYQQRLSIAHELKHVVDWNEPPASPYEVPAGWTLHDVEERFADYFARCVLMPKTLVHRTYASGVQSVTDLAARFEVPETVVHARLSELGLVRRLPPRASRVRRSLIRVRASIGNQFRAVISSGIARQ